MINSSKSLESGENGDNNSKNHDPYIKRIIDNILNASNLGDFLEKNFSKYKGYDSEMINLAENIWQAKNKIELDGYSDLTEDQLLEVFNFIEGEKNQEIKNKLVLLKIDYIDILNKNIDSDSKIMEIIGLILKANTYNECIKENEQKEIEFYGFEENNDLRNIKDLMYFVFGNDILKRCLISKIRYFEDIVLIRIGDYRYTLPLHQYIEIKQLFPEIKNYKFRAESFTNWNLDNNFSKSFTRTPIDCFSCYDEDLDNLDYLDDFQNEEKMKIYKTGNICHEIAHHIYDYLFNEEMYETWKQIASNNSPITRYIGLYKESNKHLYYDEFFTESIRLYTTSPLKLKEGFNEIFNFIAKYFPEIKRINEF